MHKKGTFFSRDLEYAASDGCILTVAYFFPLKDFCLFVLCIFTFHCRWWSLLAKAIS